MRTCAFILAMVVTLLCGGCNAVFGPSGSTPAERRNGVLRERDAMIAKLAKRRPSLMREIDDAPGYAFFYKSNLHLFLFSSEDGYGVVTERNGQNTYMRMYGTGAGFGIGAKEFYVLMIFKRQKVLEDFIRHGMDFRGSADAGVKVGDLDAFGSGGESVQSWIDVYQLTELGGAFQITLQGNKYWLDPALNDP